MTGGGRLRIIHVYCIPARWHVSDQKDMRKRLDALNRKALPEQEGKSVEADEARCGELVEQSLAMVTALAPRIGYDAAAEIAKQAHAAGKTIRQVCLENNVLPEDVRPGKFHILRRHAVAIHTETQHLALGYISYKEL